MKLALSLSCSLFTLMAVAAGAQQIESLPTAEAFDRVRELRGVVLVDLYADW